MKRKFGSNPQDAPAAARPGIVGKTGPGMPLGAPLPYGGGIAAFKDPVTPPFGQQIGPRPNKGQPWRRKFIPPLALFNDAAQWVNRKWFVRPMTLLMNPDSNPLLHAQYFTPPPLAISSLAAGSLNLQLQLGNIVNQAAQLSIDDSTFYGG